MALRVLIINQTGKMGGAEWGLLDLATYLGGGQCSVLLFSDGPLRGRLEAAGIPVSVITARDSFLKISRDGSIINILAGLPGLNAVLRELTTAARVIGISNTVCDAYVAAGGRARQVSMVLNSVHSPERFERVGEEQAVAVRRELGLLGKPVVGLFGRIAPWKGQHVLVEALAMLPEVEALFVGDALFGEDGYKQGVLDQARRLGVSQRCHWLGQRDDVDVLMRAVDIVVHASTAGEPFGRVIAEGLLARRPVLATRCGASTEVLGEDHEGLVPPGDAKALAGAISATLAIPEARLAEQAAAGWNRARQLFMPDRMAAEIEQVLHETLRDSAGSRRGAWVPWHPASRGLPESGAAANSGSGGERS
jgi:glycosyltransferase involved in cell wall biosynthesis